jgi:hypothetical protein
LLLTAVHQSVIWLELIDFKGTVLVWWNPSQIDSPRGR